MALTMQWHINWILMERTIVTDVTYRLTSLTNRLLCQQTLCLFQGTDNASVEAIKMVVSVNTES